MIFLDKIIELSFYLLFFLVPIVLSPLNYELFEYNKMMLTYAVTIIITGVWLAKIVLKKKVEITRTPFDIPILLFLLSQVVSTVFSIDRHVSIFGYYSRFHGGLLSSISYVALFYAFTTNFPKEKTRRLLLVILTSAALVALYGILEHFGIDANYWIQDVKNRVFSSLGQPNWLAAYLAILIPISVGLCVSIKNKLQENEKNEYRKTLNNSQRSQTNEFLVPLSYALLIIFYITLLYTKSRSGFIGVWAGISIFLVSSTLSLLDPRRAKKTILKGILVLTLIIITTISTTVISVLPKIIALPLYALFSAYWLFDLFNTIKEIRAEGAMEKKQKDLLTKAYPSIKKPIVVLATLAILTFFIGSPFSEINNFFSLDGITKRIFSSRPVKQAALPTGPALEIGGTESGKIRAIVWKGAIDIFRNFPVFGSGVETFAFSYYKYRPIEHNMVSEWDFLYNKAHNEYLNFLATTGAFGLGTYLLFILSFIVWNVSVILNEVKNPARFTKSLRDPSATPQDDNPFKNRDVLLVSLFSGWLTILITNFFGFSVVIVGIFFFLIPAISFLLSQERTEKNLTTESDISRQEEERSSPVQKMSVFIVLLAICYLLFAILRMWQADTKFAKARNYASGGYSKEAFQEFQDAVKINPNEPFYRNEFSNTAAELAFAVKDQDATLSASLASLATYESDLSIKEEPQNVNYYKTRTRVFYTLSAIDVFPKDIQDKYEREALLAIKKASDLAPTDPKVFYNLGILYGRIGERDKALDAFEKTAKMKPDYRDAYFAIGLYYHDLSLDENGNLKNKALLQKAIDQMNYILNRISANDTQAKEKLEEWKKL